MQSLDRRILSLAVPALGALLAEPLFLITDSAMVGHLGVPQLAGLGLAMVILQSLIGVLIFLAYSTTPAVARRIGAGDEPGAVSAGWDGIWLAATLGAGVAVLGVLIAPSVLGLFGAPAEVAEHAGVYLGISMLGVPAMLIVFAATGLLRGLQDTRTPLLVTVCGFAMNAGLNAVLIYGANLGVAGSAIGTVVAQWLMAAAFLVVVGRHAARTGASVRPRLAGIGGSARDGSWVFLRSISLRVATIAATVLATGLGTSGLAGFQVMMTIFTTAAFAMDALAIAAQALVGRGLGAGDAADVRRVLRRCLLWGAGAGVGLGLVIALTAPWTGLLFTGDADLAALLAPSLVIVGLGAPLAGIVFVLDGVLLGAGDGRYLGLTGLANTAAFIIIASLVPWGSLDAGAGLTALTAAFALGYIAARACTLVPRALGNRWQRLGV